MIIRCSEPRPPPEPLVQLIAPSTPLSASRPTTRLQGPQANFSSGHELQQRNRSWRVT
ncbi:uncharacterized protein BO87DRAFT_378310 [Aspergillus neoniger CBS 115656]|uniref:Uncharacterized protein n=1 Tax=Aspergillus neoniger (strain CBS 115656) TaxID=1448310 RepID=A0A318YEG1_ASPNB|nr:hypothetical protein BO87DRAFT_378310 [Aspergillus neoniger CBS 115656]PYH32434.1 hypothetical protein BO87DRAFT_378310 [Aspergillus neoniger CBS 115656]